MDIQDFALYFVSTFLIILSPGASAILVLSKGAAQGARKGSMVIAGFNIATSLYFLLSALGVTAIIVASEQAFNVIKWLGVGYLVYLGFVAIFSKSGTLTVKPESASDQSLLSRVSQGFVVEFSNPKAVLYFSSILPQFLDLTRPLAPQIAIMMIVATLLQWLIYSGYALLGDHISKAGIKPFILSLMNKTMGAALLFVAYEMSRVKA